MKKSITFITVIIIILGAILFLINPFKKEQTPFSSSEKPATSSEIGQKIADFELESFEALPARLATERAGRQGEKVKLSQFAGKPILIDFWAAWCPFCLDEMPEIEKIHQAFGPPAGGELVVLGIHRSETEGIETGSKFAKKRGVTYTLLKDSTGQVYKTLTGGRNFMPYALYIDKEGNIIKTKAGPKTAEEMRQSVEELLKL